MDSGFLNGVFFDNKKFGYLFDTLSRIVFLPEFKMWKMEIKKKTLTSILFLSILLTFYTLYLHSHKNHHPTFKLSTQNSTAYTPFIRLAKSYYQPPKYFHEKGNWNEESSHRDARYGGDGVSVDGEIHTMLVEWTEFTRKHGIITWVNHG